MKKSIKCGSTTIVIKLKSDTHELIEATTARGYVFACTSAIGDTPLTLEEAKEIWKTKREIFRPYNQSTGCFLA